MTVVCNSVLSVDKKVAENGMEWKQGIGERELKKKRIEIREEGSRDRKKKRKIIKE